MRKRKLRSRPRPSLAALALALALLPGCSAPPIFPAAKSRDRAFTAYWPGRDDAKYLRVAVKDLIDVKGTVTSAGSRHLAQNGEPAKRDAECLQALRRANVRIVGKTNLSEFALGTAGLNEYFGTPKNYLSDKSRLIPGGSSSGSAVAVANFEAEVAIGTDTAGSIRVPAACCGILGLKTTHGLIPLKGVHPISPMHLDTVGPMARDVEHLVKGMDLLKPGFSAQYRKAVAARPAAKSIRVGRLYLPGTDPEIDRAVDEALAQAGFQVVPLGKRLVEQWDEAKKHGRTIALAEGWFWLRGYLSKKGVSAPTKATILLGEVEYKTGYDQALAGRKAWQRTLRRVFRRVDFIALPTMQSLPPRVPFWGRLALFDAAVFNIQNTAAVNVAGNPAIAIPIPVKDKRVPLTSLQLIGPNLSEARLVNAARIMENQNRR